MTAKTARARAPASERSGAAEGYRIRLFSLIALTFLWAAWNIAAAERPNVILILTDDQGYGDLHAHGNPHLDTPVMDKLQLSGARFERFYVSPVCAPTRAALMTGRYYLRTGVSGVVPDHLATMRLDELTIAEALRPAGYATALVGKWHLGKFYPQHPNRQGFTEFFGFRSGASPYYDATLDHNGKPVVVKEYLTDVLTDRAIAFIEAHRNQPFFLYLPYNAPHSPLQVPDRYFDKYKARGLNDRLAAIYGMVESIDWNLGRLLAKLDELGLSQNTIVIFTSDNGPAGRRYNAGMKGTKGSADEGGVRVPLFIRWPGRIQPGTVIDRLAAAVDIFPTIMDLCGVTPPAGKPLDGISLAPLLENPNADWPERMICSVRLRESEGELRFLAAAGIRTPRWRLTISRGKPSLYDMKADPGQTRDVAAEHPEVTAFLHRAFNRWYQDVTRDGIVRFPVPLGYDEEPEVKLLAPDAYLWGHVSVKGKVPWDIYWIHSWKDTEDHVWWDVDNVRDGLFEVSVSYAAPGEGPAGRILIEAAGRKLEAELPCVRPRPGETGRNRRNLRMPLRETLVKAKTIRKLGVVRLPKGRYNLYFRPLTQLPAGFRLNGLILRRLESGAGER